MSANNITFQQHLSVAGVSALTAKTYLGVERTLSAWYASEYQTDFQPGWLTNYDLRAFRHWSLDVARVSASTWNTRRAALVAYCAMLGDPSLMDGVDACNPSEPQIRWLDDQEYGRLMRQLERLPKMAVTAGECERATRDRAMLGLMLFAGLRVSEVTALTVADVEIGERSGRVLVRHGKGDKRAEVPFMSVVARKWVTEWINAAGLGGNDPLFGVTSRTAQRAVTEIGAGAQIAGLSAHDLRHTYLKRTIQGKNSRDGQPVPLEIVKKLARHSRLETTLRYVEPSWDEMESAVGGV